MQRVEFSRAQNAQNQYYTYYYIYFVLVNAQSEIVTQFGAVTCEAHSREEEYYHDYLYIIGGERLELLDCAATPLFPKADRA